MIWDLKIVGGSVVDGTGAPVFNANLAVKDGRIVEIGRCEGVVVMVIDVEGVIVVFFSINGVATPPMVSIPSVKGVTSNNNTLVVSPDNTEP